MELEDNSAFTKNSCRFPKEIREVFTYELADACKHFLGDLGDLNV